MIGVSYFSGYYAFYNAGRFAMTYPSEAFLMIGFTGVLTLGIMLYFFALLRGFIPYRTMAARMVERIARFPFGVVILKFGRVYVILFLLLIAIKGANAWGGQQAKFNFENICMEGRFVISQNTASIEKVMCIVADSDSDYFVLEPGLKLPQPTLIPKSQILSVTILGPKKVERKTAD